MFRNTGLSNPQYPYWYSIEIRYGWEGKKSDARCKKQKKKKIHKTLREKNKRRPKSRVKDENTAESGCDDDNRI